MDKPIIVDEKDHPLELHLPDKMAAAIKILALEFGLTTLSVYVYTPEGTDNPNAQVKAVLLGLDEPTLTKACLEWATVAES